MEEEDILAVLERIKREPNLERREDMVDDLSPEFNRYLSLDLKESTELKLVKMFENVDKPSDLDIDFSSFGERGVVLFNIEDGWDDSRSDSVVIIPMGQRILMSITNQYEHFDEYAEREKKKFKENIDQLRLKNCNVEFEPDSQMPQGNRVSIKCSIERSLAWDKRNQLPGFIRSNIKTVRKKLKSARFGR